MWSQCRLRNVRLSKITGTSAGGDNPPRQRDDGVPTGRGAPRYWEHQVKKFWLSATVTLYFSLAASHAASNSAHHAITQVSTQNPALTAALTDLKMALFAPRTALLFDNGGVANNCAQYSNLLSSGAPYESTRSAEIRSEYLVCDAVQMLGLQPFIVTQASLPANAARTLFERLDMRSFPSSLRNRADGQTHTLNTLLASGKVTMTRDTVEVETNTQFFSLKIVGVVKRPANEFGGRRLQKEWIVWVGDELKDGNYKSYRTLIVRLPSDSRGGQYTGSIHPMQ